MTIFRTSAAGKIISMGCAIVVLKCGTLGYYVQTSDRRSALRKWAGQRPRKYRNNGQTVNSFQAYTKWKSFKSATGAGDTSIAGFLAAFLRGHSPQVAINAACATGALCVTSYGAVDAVEPLESVLGRIRAGWEKSAVGYAGSRFVYDDQNALYQSE